MSDLENEMDFLFAEAKLGIQVEEFLSSNVGRYMKGRAEEDLKNIQMKLLKTPAWQAETAKTLQLEAQGLQKLMGWLSDAINNGHLSEHQLQELEEIERQ